MEDIFDFNMLHSATKLFLTTFLSKGMLQITLDSQERKNSSTSHVHNNWGFKVKLINQGDSSELILSFEEESSSNLDDSEDLSLGEREAYLDPIS